MEAGKRDARGGGREASGRSPENRAPRGGLRTSPSGLDEGSGETDREGPGDFAAPADQRPALGRMLM